MALKSQGATMIVAEGQHLAIDPNYGGPGLGIFGIRYNENDKVSIRSTAEDTLEKRRIKMVMIALQWFFQLESNTLDVRKRLQIFALIKASSQLLQAQTCLT